MNSKSEKRIINPSPYKIDLASHIAHAREVRAKLANLKTIQLSDREIFAKNLGALFREIERLNGDLKFTDVFTQALGDTFGESLVKKRRTVMIFDGESSNSQGFRSSPLAYIQIADVLSRLLPIDIEESEPIGMLRLVEGSSFDVSGAVRDKLTAQYASDLLRVLRFALNKVQKNVNLDWLYEWSSDQPWNTGGKTGELDWIAQPGSDCSLDFSLDGGYSQQRNCCPCVPIAWIEQNVYSPKSVLLEVNGDIPDFCQAIIEFAKRNNVTEDEDWNHELTICEAVQMLAQVPADCFEDVELNLKAKFRADLEIRYNERMGRWEPLILYRYVCEDGIHPDPACIWNGSYTNNVQYLDVDWEFDGGWCYALDEGDGRYRVFFLNLNDIAFYGHGIENELVGVSSIGTGFPLQGDLSDDLALKTGLVEYKAGLLTEPPINTFVPVTKGSLAYHILGNFVGTDGDDRFDNILLKDALTKEKMIRSFALEKENSFRSTLEVRLIEGVAPETSS
ncbi:MAG: hypothetical protein VW437_03375 [Betaproteobacteria bacterium]